MQKNITVHYFQICSIFCNMQSYHPVSYTHLDVYKRQLVTYLGVYSSGGRQSNWIRNAVPADELLSIIESGVASKVLACIGNANRLAILLEILRGPKTVASLVEKCDFGSTGQVYHHMKPLLAADIVVEDEKQKGVYVIQPHRVPVSYTHLLPMP